LKAFSMGTLWSAQQVATARRKLNGRPSAMVAGNAIAVAWHAASSSIEMFSVFSVGAH
jgi:hypothetical protein